MASRIPLPVSPIASPLSPGAELKGIRQYLGWSQVRFAERVGVHPVSLTRWETGAKPVPQTVMGIFAQPLEPVH